MVVPYRHLHKLAGVHKHLLALAYLCGLLQPFVVKHLLVSDVNTCILLRIAAMTRLTRYGCFNHTRRRYYTVVEACTHPQTYITTPRTIDVPHRPSAHQRPICPQ